MADLINPDVTFVDAPRSPSGGEAEGASGALQIRLAPEAYPDSGATMTGGARPSARVISNVVFEQLDASGRLEDMPNRQGASSLLWVWGQFIDHDLVRTPNGSELAPIVVPRDDPVFAPGSNIGFSRSGFASGTGASASDPRQFANTITSYLDGSNVYGSNQAQLDGLRVAGEAKLRLTEDGNILFGSGGGTFGTGPIAGDGRAAENVGLLAMHGLFAREHNRIVDALAAANPGLTVEERFEGARARVEAIIQAITYNEFLPLLLGRDALPAYEGHREDVTPAVSLEFSTVAYRFGHSTLSPFIARRTESGRVVDAGDLALRDAFQVRPGVIEATGDAAILRGLSATHAQALDARVIEDVRSMLFGGGGVGSDLVSLNIQRGRDHGVPSYNGLRAALGLDPVSSFDEVAADAETQARLERAYGDVRALDAWVGGLAEAPVGGGMVGETFRAILVDQFARLRAGDPLWSEGRGFDPAELAVLQATTLADVIRRNSDVEVLQNEAFIAHARIGGGAGADTLTAGPSRTLLVGLAGDDTLTGNLRDDHIDGGVGRDTLRGGGGSDLLDGGIHPDVLIGGAGADRLIGGFGQDRLTGGSGVDRIEGGDGDDFIFLRGDAGAFDVMAGGPGRDTVRSDDPGADIILNGTGRVSGVEAFDGVGGSVLGTSRGETFEFAAFAAVSRVAAIDGRGGADTIRGGAASEVIRGGDGGDTLQGRGGVDRLTGGTGGDAFLFIAAQTGGADVVTDFDVAGNDRLRLLGFDFGVANPGAMTGGQKAAAVGEATRFDTRGATIDLEALGGQDTVRLDGVTRATFVFASEDLVFA